MKTFRIFGSVFCVFGFIFALLGILSSIFPLIENEHFKLILNSFQETSTDPLTNTLNAIVRFCLHSSYFLLFCGISLMVAGGLINSTAHKKQTSFNNFEHDTQIASPNTSQTLGVPRPAYYPGGLEPTAHSLSSGNGVKITILEDDDGPLDIGSSASLKAVSISGGNNLSFSSDENDAQKLMHNDQQIKSQEHAELLFIPDNAQYLSNNLTDEIKSARKLDNQPPEEPKQSDVVQPLKPRIVSTMGRPRL